MFPLVNQDSKNTLHLFQLWINLPRKDKFTEPHYKMLWSEDIPIIEASEGKVKVTLISGQYQDHVAPPPAPNSWAADQNNKVDIYLIEMEADSEIDLPSRSKTQKRALYFYMGEHLEINEERLDVNQQAYLNSDAKHIKNTGKKAYFLFLQAEPINEPVTQYGPFVMNNMEEIRQAYDDFQKTQFGGWPWDRPDPVHPVDQKRFAKYANGQIEKPE
jgi:redox-sensitive bicupin YhaK (pirin superfamily)